MKCFDSLQMAENIDKQHNTKMFFRWVSVVCLRSLSLCPNGACSFGLSIVDCPSILYNVNILNKAQYLEIKKFGPFWNNKVLNTIHSAV